VERRQGVRRALRRLAQFPALPLGRGRALG
jgi:hypothetical protein